MRGNYRGSTLEFVTFISETHQGRHDSVVEVNIACDYTLLKFDGKGSLILVPRVKKDAVIIAILQVNYYEALKLLEVL
jgi:hypothetical protein